MPPSTLMELGAPLKLGATYFRTARMAVTAWHRLLPHIRAMSCLAQETYELCQDSYMTHEGPCQRGCWKVTGPREKWGSTRQWPVVLGTDSCGMDKSPGEELERPAVVSACLPLSLIPSRNQ